MLDACERALINSPPQPAKKRGKKKKKRLIKVRMVYICIHGGEIRFNFNGLTCRDQGYLQVLLIFEYALLFASIVCCSDELLF